MNKVAKKVLIISGINFFEGGPLSLLKDCLTYLNTSEYVHHYEIIVLVHKKQLFDQNEYLNITFIELPKARQSYLYRLYYEYIYFKKISNTYKADFWLSMHDITPNVGNIKQAVYCHNPSPFNTINFRDLIVQPTQFFFRLFYKFLYQINIHKNQYVIVQQNWIKEKFVQMFDLNELKIIVSIPQVPYIPVQLLGQRVNEEKQDLLFFFPTFPRPFKNIEVICEAVEILNKKNISGFKVVITIDGSENKYAGFIIQKYGSIKNIDFIGLITRAEVYQQYYHNDCLIFPSKLETWGMPISEFKQYKKPMLIANLPYAKETAGGYDKVNFFDPLDPDQLCIYMEQFINGRDIKYDQTYPTKYTQPFAENWQQLFNILLSN